ncbi:MAG TPA: alpha/beta hydrolase-fold protein [Rhizomicrobium sp.]|jgi:predicted alpha/beta superfamily hydrolase
MVMQLNSGETVGGYTRFAVEVDGLGRYTIDVSLPANPPPNKRLPVILTLDGNLLFDLVRPIVHGGMSAANMVLPPALVVGIGYPVDEGFSGFYARRNFDFHGPWAMRDPFGQRVHEIFTLIKTGESRPDLQMQAGGYNRFMTFLADELMPALVRTFPVDADARHTLIGMSSGGHFALRALFDKRSPFGRYVVISPSFHAANGAIAKAEAEYAAQNSDLDTEIFICAGTEEIAVSADSALCGFGAGVIWCAQQFALRGWPSASLQWEIMSNEDHASIAPRGIATGLRAVHRLRPGVHGDELAAAVAALEANFSKPVES